MVRKAVKHIAVSISPLNLDARIMSRNQQLDVSISRGEVYQEGVGSIEQASVFGEAALQEILEDKKKQLARYVRARPDNPESKEKHPVSFDNEVLKRMHVTSVEDSLYELRNAFALSAYHFWETSIYRWYLEDNPGETAKNLGSYAKLKSVMAELHERDPSLPNAPDSHLEAVCRLANILKHTSSKSCEWMKNHAPPELQSIKKQIGQMPPGLSVRLNNEELTWIFNIIRRSGPGYRAN
ncbi:hypothetical protein HC62_00240 [Acetobacter tropicalis]|uniref:Uncharacterized protein n=2 Tax=Acetobacter tropicalis TaxID=104102 RepID=A0A251ZYR4_9PROT|nr:hypothetical protein HC62_00240 [Acetobacter tropicalis]